MLFKGHAELCLFELCILPYNNDIIVAIWNSFVLLWRPRTIHNTSSVHGNCISSKLTLDDVMYPNLGGALGL